MMGCPTLSGGSELSQVHSCTPSFQSVLAVLTQLIMWDTVSCPSQSLLQRGREGGREGGSSIFLLSIFSSLALERASNNVSCLNIKLCFAQKIESFHPPRRLATASVYGLP